MLNIEVLCLLVRRTKALFNNKNYTIIIRPKVINYKDSKHLLKYIHYWYFRG
jgi:hypothetical protein